MRLAGVRGGNAEGRDTYAGGEMSKKTLAIVTIALLVFAACGGAGDANPAAFGDEGNEDKRESKAQRAPANDNFASAESVSRISFSKAASNSRATLESGEPRLCGEIDKTVWYRYTPTRDMNVTAQATAGFPTVVSVFSGTDMAALTEVGCAATGNETALTFGALEGQTYNIQIGSTGGSEGSIDVTMRNANQAQLLLGDPGPLLPGWIEKVLVEETTVETPPVGPVDLDLVTIDGAPRATDAKWYDIRITAAGAPVETISLRTEGLLTQPIHLELVQLAKESTKAAIKLFYRFDPEQVNCRLEIGGKCTISLPFNPTDVNWTTEEGPTAELIILAKVDVGKADINGTAADVDVPNPLFVRIPLLGQVRAITG